MKTLPVVGTVRHYRDNPAGNPQHLAPGTCCSKFGCERNLSNDPAYYMDYNTFRTPGGGFGISFFPLCLTHGKEPTK